MDSIEVRRRSDLRLLGWFNNRHTLNDLERSPWICRANIPTMEDHKFGVEIGTLTDAKLNEHHIVLIDQWSDVARLDGVYFHRAPMGKPGSVRMLPTHHTRQDWFILGVISTVVVTGVVTWML